MTPVADGGNLAKQLFAGECFGGSEASALEMYSQIVEAVRSIHENGVVHRDLKPGNIVIHRGHVLLADLGFCLSLTSEVPRGPLALAVGKGDSDAATLPDLRLRNSPAGAFSSSRRTCEPELKVLGD